jgi:hypothetical protein
MGSIIGVLLDHFVAGALIIVVGAFDLEGFGDLLGDRQGDLALQLRLRVRRAVDLAHAAPANLGDDFIRAEASTRSQGQFVLDYTGRN